LGGGVFYKSIVYDSTKVDVVVFQAGPGDVNGDGRFDFDDLVIIFSDNASYGAPAAGLTWLEGDFNGDGAFDFADLQLAFAKLGPHYSQPYYAAPLSSGAIQAETYAAELLPETLVAAPASAPAVSTIVDASTPQASDPDDDDSSVVRRRRELRTRLARRLAAHDAVLSRDVERKLPERDARFDRYMWLRDRDQAGPRDWRFHKPRRAELAVDKLLALWP